MSDKETTAAILAHLKASNVERIWASELSLAQGGRRCDFWTLHPHRSKGYLAEAYEIKASRADFKREDDAKQRDSRLYSDRFWYVAPIGIIKPDEVPVWAGLQEWNGERLIAKVPAPHRDKDAPSWELVVSMIRNCGEINRETDILKERLRVAERNLRYERDRNDGLARNLRDMSQKLNKLEDAQ
jgi:hypothetical protein